MEREMHMQRHKGKYEQIGSSTLFLDLRFSAEKPGKRISRTGKVYYERRKNRSDKPGSRV
jgi:hypothetical protein